VQEGVGGWGLDAPGEAVKQHTLHTQQVLHLWGLKSERSARAGSAVAQV
jgi:hypothetical protein